MPRSYHLQLAAYAADADPKWVDNLLSHFDIPGVELAGAGVPRRIAPTGVYHIALIRALTRAAHFPTHAAVTIAAQLLGADESPAASLELTPAIELRLDAPVFRRQIDARIADAVDTIAPRRRGRPSAKKPPV
jgi:hypothetical protein